MTYEEAIAGFRKAIEIIDANIDHYFEDTKQKILEEMEEFEISIKAIEKQNKYRWHDLRKNPRDLPEDGETVEVVYEYYDFDAEADLPKYGHSRYYHDIYGTEFWGGDAFNGLQLNVIAWRYIEPIEEEDEE